MTIEGFDQSESLWIILMALMVFAYAIRLLGRAVEWMMKRWLT